MVSYASPHRIFRRQDGFLSFLNCHVFSPACCYYIKTFTALAASYEFSGNSARAWRLALVCEKAGFTRETYDFPI